MLNYRHHLSAVWPPLILSVSAGVAAWVIPGNWGVPLAAAFCAVMALDAAARLKEYRSAVAAFSDLRHFDDGFHVLLHKHKRSWCQREMLKAAAATVFNDGRRTVSQAYRFLGYRWFHVFPDRTFSRHSPFLKWSFWKELLTAQS